MKQAKAIYFDMDGTIANLYAVEQWESKLNAHNPTPYEQAKTLVNMAYLARLLNKVQKQGYAIGIVSWLAKYSNDNYDKQVINAKLVWLKKHLPSVDFDEITIVKYGTPKANAVMFENGILFDDEEQNRKAWKGQAYTEKEIFEILKNLVKNA